jgi:hypothetical protein
MKNLYIIDYENAHWCGGQLHVVVWAYSPAHAEILVSDWMEETQRELFADEYGESVSEDEEFADERAYTVNSVSILDINNEHWEFYNDPSQESFYPVVNNE